MKTTKQKSPLLPTPLSQEDPESPPLLPTTISHPKKQKPPLSESGEELLLRKQKEMMVVDIKSRQTIDSRKSEISSPPTSKPPAFEKVFRSERVVRFVIF